MREYREIPPCMLCETFLAAADNTLCEGCANLELEDDEPVSLHRPAYLFNLEPSDGPAQSNHSA